MTLSLVDLSSRTETRLTRPHGRHSADLGDIDARRVAGGLFLRPPARAATSSSPGSTTTAR